MTRSRISSISTACVEAWRHALALTVRERDRLIAEIAQVRGLMPLLMKPRNGEKWSPADKAELRRHCRRLRSISPYLVRSIVPGSLVALPILAWWLDRRRNRGTDTPPVAAPYVALDGPLDVQRRRQAEQAQEHEAHTPEVRIKQRIDVSIENAD